ncbi:hypothetical protein FACS1894103_5530 [Campylobacterota bacterium]|nr:hypothetical protein FACS1894103_5530 [Campylobacterota bacterium]
MFGLYNLAGFDYWLSSASNYFFASILSFFLNKYWTFQTKEFSIYMIIAFALNILICYLIAYSAAKPLVYLLLENHSQIIRDNISMGVGMCIFTALNYLGQRFVVFNYAKKETNVQ